MMTLPLSAVYQLQEALDTEVSELELFLGMLPIIVVGIWCLYGEFQKRNVRQHQDTTILGAQALKRFEIGRRSVIHWERLYDHVYFTLFVDSNGVEAGYEIELFEPEEIHFYVPDYADHFIAVAMFSTERSGAFDYRTQLLPQPVRRARAA